MEMPRQVKKTKPEFPKDAVTKFRELGIKRTRVLLRVIIQKDGRVDRENFVLLEAIHPSLVVSACNEINQKWRFEPGRKNGDPVDVWATVEVTYNVR